MMIQESEFRPSLLGKILDKVLFYPPVPPFDIQVGLARANGPYERLLQGRISDPRKAEKARTDYYTWYNRLYQWVHRNDEPGSTSNTSQ